MDFCNKIKKYFFKHIEEQKTNYMHHCITSLHISTYFLLSSIKAFIHAFIPCIFTTSSSDCVRDIQDFIKHSYKSD